VDGNKGRSGRFRSSSTGIKTNIEIQRFKEKLNSRAPIVPLRLSASIPVSNDKDNHRGKIR